MPPTYKHCQSCDIPLKRDEQGGGTNADGSKSTMYCSHCFVNGQFTLPDCTPEQMQKLVSSKLGEMGFPKFTHWFFISRIPKLARWNKTG